MARSRDEWEGLPVWWMDRASLIRNKRAVGRAKDLADLELLGESTSASPHSASPVSSGVRFGCDAIVDWLNSRAELLSKEGFKVEVIRSIPSDNPSARLEFTNDRAIGGITGWESGEFFFEA